MYQKTVDNLRLRYTVPKLSVSYETGYFYSEGLSFSVIFLLRQNATSLQYRKFLHI